MSGEVDAVITDWKIILPGFQDLTESVWCTGKLLWCNKNDEVEAVESEENRFGATTIVVRVRPPPEPPPRVNRRILEFAYLSFMHFNFQVKTFVFCCYFILCCKTLALGLSFESSTVIIIGFKLPNLGLASYTAFLQVVNSQSRPRADNYLCMVL
ncbi:unnamed protein product, partial [Cuscuta epithymum]